MKKFLVLILFVAAVPTLFACGNNKEIPQSVPTNAAQQTPTPTQPLASPPTPTPVPTSTPTPTPTPEPMTEEKLNALLAEQPLVITSTKYVVQDTSYKSLYPDMLQAIIKNNSEDDIQSAVIAFVAWDTDGFPVKIKGNYDYSGGSFTQLVNYGEVNLAPGKSYGQSGGFSIDEDNKIKTFKAIVESYSDFNGEVWNNPYYDDFVTMYEGKRLKDVPRDEI